MDAGYWVLLGAVGLGLILASRARWGSAARGARRERRARIEGEDALKHLYHCEYAGSHATLESLCGALTLSRAGVVALAERLESAGLLQTVPDGLQLTDAGRTIALQVIRVHRLWEVYLADQTGLPPENWHREADRREHETSETLLDHLTQTTGDPVFDPHGDPIPTADGQIVPRRGMPLSQLDVGELGVVVHVEDEPEPIDAQLVADGLGFQSRVRLLDISREQITVQIDGRVRSLSPIVAANVWVEPLPADAEELGREVERLSALELGESARVVRIAPACRGLQRRRLLDLGLVPGTTVTAELRSPSGDPTAYRVRGAVISLRRGQADLILTEPIEAQHAAVAGAYGEASGT